MLCGVYGLVLGCYANQKTVLIGIPVTTKNHPDLENLLGFFVNMLVLNINVEPNQLLAEYFQKINSDVNDVQRNQIQFERLVKEFAVEKDISKNPIFQVLFNFVDEGKKEYSNPIFADYDPYANMENIKTTMKYDLEMHILSTKPCIQGSLNFYTKIFDKKTVQHFLECYMNVLNQLTKRIEKRKIHEIGWISSSPKETAEKLKSKLKFEVASKETVNLLFEDIAEKHHSKTAVICGEKKFTYNELNERANQLAHQLNREVKN